MNNKRLADIVTKNVCVISPDTPLTQAVELMGEQKISCLIVTEKSAPVGLITERDIVRLAAEGGISERVTVAEVMTSPVITTPASLTIFETYSSLKIDKRRHIIAVDDTGKMVGVATQTDIIESLELGIGEVRPVSGIMTREMVKTDPETSLYEVITAMALNDISCVVVEEEGKPVGIFSERDVTRLSSKPINLAALPVSDCMTSPVFSVDTEAPLFEAARIMKLHKVRRLAITNAEGETAGLVTQSDIVRGLLEGKYLDYLRGELESKESALRSAEDSLYERTLFLEKVLQSAEDVGMVVIGSKGSLDYFNNAASRIAAPFSLDKANSSAERFFEAVGLGSDFFERAVKNPSDTPRHAINRIVRGGQILWLEYAFFVMQGRDEAIGYLLTLRDITDQKRQEEVLRAAMEQAENATRLKDKFVNLVAHDLRSPLTSQIGMMRLLEEEERFTASEREMIVALRENGERMAQMIDSLLDLSRLQSGVMQLQKEEREMRAIAALAIASSSHQVGAKGITIINDIPADRVEIVDPILFGEALHNLVSNAVKFCRSGDRITLTSPDPSTLIVSDTGVGIDADIINHLFEHETKTTRTGTDGEQGSGLGLPYCREIVEAHGGTISVHSQPGAGATFTISFP